SALGQLLAFEGVMRQFHAGGDQEDGGPLAPRSAKPGRAGRVPMHHGLRDRNARDAPGAAVRSAGGRCQQMALDYRRRSDPEFTRSPPKWVWTKCLRIGISAAAS